MRFTADNLGQRSSDGRYTLADVNVVTLDPATNWIASIENLRWVNVRTGVEVITGPTEEPTGAAPKSTRVRPDFADVKPRNLKRAAFEHGAVELKYDGRWVWATADGETVTLTSRTGNAQRATFPANGLVGVYAAEYIYGTTWARTSGLGGAVVLFDCVEASGEDVRGEDLGTRRGHCEDAARTIGEPFTLSEQWPVTHAEWLWKTRVATGEFEGLVLKHGAAPFGTAMARCKRVCTIDFVCTAIHDEVSEIGAESIGVGLYIDGELRETGSLFGLSNAAKVELAANPDAYIGRTLRGTGMELTEAGALRHGRFSGWHEDKPATACTIEAARAASAGL